MSVYRLIQCLLLPALTVRAVWMWLRGTITATDLRESLWGPRTNGPAIWVHGASLGEVASARRVITDLSHDHDVIVTTTRKPAKTAITGWGLSRVKAALVPLDSTWVSRAMFRKNQVKMLIVIENELWPARILAAHDIGIPVVMLSARMSVSSDRVWARLPKLTAAMLGRVAMIVPQDQASADRLVALGAPQDRVAQVVKLKADYAPPMITVPDGFATWPRRKTILAAATHPGEEAMVLAAFGIARKTEPDLRLIIAPRHDTRGDEVAALITAAGLPDHRRSRGDAPTGPVFLADTLGEMALWYDLAGVTFVGGSLVPRGGHTPYEPAAHGSAILHGPYIDNFAEDYARFAANNAAVLVQSTDDMAAAMLAHLVDDAMAQRASDIGAEQDSAPLARQITALLKAAQPAPAIHPG